MKIVHCLPPYLPIFENQFMDAIPKQTIALGLEQQRQGHEVYFISSRDSFYSKINLLGTISYKKGVTSKLENILKHYQLAKEILRDIKPDIVHEHISKIRSDFFFSKTKLSCPVLYSLRAMPDDNQILKVKKARLESINQIYFNTISNRQKNLFGRDNIDYVVYHGVDELIYTLSESPDDFLLNIGRISQDKGTHLAIKLAIKMRTPLKIIGKIEDENYFTTMIKPFIQGDLVKYLGALPTLEVISYIKKAKVFVNPLNYEESFGLTMIENPMCGTPVVTFNKGAAPEIIKDGKNGFVVKSGDLEGLIQAVDNASNLNRADVRNETIRMGFFLRNSAKNYLKLYRKIIDQN